ncbi:MAG: chorismate synthase [Clostridia bacterium]|nr:chorismate synthase [Clostridia bacterium]
MKNTFGYQVTVSLFGESHGASVGALIDGLAPGLTVDEDFIRHQLTLRRPMNQLSTPRQEADPFVIESGVYHGKTTGTPLLIRIANGDVKSGDYSPFAATPRPGHADYTALGKYNGFADPRGGGHFSGRLTAALVAAAAIVIPALRQKGITIATHIARIADVSDRAFDDLVRDTAKLNDAVFAVLDDDAAANMQAAILTAAEDGDSVGGVLETAVTGIPVGVGEPWFDTLESVLAHALFSIPAVKGVEFGDGFAMSGMRGSQANDCFTKDGDAVVTATNHNGGINGGISNGMPLIMRCAVKPTPTIHKTQHTLNLQTGEMTDLVAGGRHDPCIVHRARVVADSMVALTLCDMLSIKYGTDWLAK